jgi:hypothetical protein
MPVYGQFGAATEALDQLAAADVRPNAMFLASATGGTRRAWSVANGRRGRIDGPSSSVPRRPAGSELNRRGAQVAGLASFVGAPPCRLGDRLDGSQLGDGYGRRTAAAEGDATPRADRGCSRPVTRRGAGRLILRARSGGRLD